MKKILTLTLSALMIMTLSACGKDTDSSESSSEASSSVSEAENNAQSGTVGDILLSEFRGKAEADPSMSAQALADAVISNEIIKFQAMTMPVEQGLLTGFGNTEIKGFSEGVMFAPGIGSIPFVGYIFKIPEDGDVNAFLDTLKSSADKRWNVCTEADSMIAESSGNTVFFLMCPDSLEEE